MNKHKRRERDALWAIQRAERQAPQITTTANAPTTDGSAIGGKVFTADSFENFTSRVGLGTQNQASNASYGFNPITRNRLLLEQAHRGSWICGMAIDIIPNDMTREGVDIHSGEPPEVEQQLRDGIKRRRIWDSLRECMQWGRLYGGAIGYIMIRGQDPSTPLNPDSVGKDQFQGIMPLDRWTLLPSLTDLIKTLTPDFGLPKFYEVVGASSFSGLPRARIHHSRVIRFEGIRLPYYQRITENMWGMSVLERLWDRLVPYDSTTNGTAQLVYKAHLRTLKIDNLREIIGFGGDALTALLKQIDMIRQYQTNEGMTLLDGADDMQINSYTFSGLSDVLLRLGEQLSGALGVPLVRLFGQSPAGLNSTGESDLRIYYDTINSLQEADLRSGVDTVYDLTYRSEFGRAPAKPLHLPFRALWQLKPEEKAQVLDNKTASISTVFTAGIITRSTALQELRNSSRETGVFSNITDEEIKEAENDPPPGEFDDAELKAQANPGLNKSEAGKGQGKPNESAKAH